jgi:hypothetical protein
MERRLMTLYEFRCALRDVRDNRKQIKSILCSLKTIREDELSTIFSGAIDYSADKVQHQSDPDARIINAIARIDKDTERLLEKLDRLESNDQRFEKMIYEADGIGAEVVRLYVLEGLRWQDVAVQVGYSERYCQELYSRSTQTMWQKYEKSA